jgi:hypothetical protein
LYLAAFALFVHFDFGPGAIQLGLLSAGLGLGAQLRHGLRQFGGVGRPIRRLESQAALGQVDPLALCATAIETGKHSFKLPRIAARRNPSASLAT